MILGSRFSGDDDEALMSVQFEAYGTALRSLFDIARREVLLARNKKDLGIE